jgi:glycolate dehydrogenase FAD-binding subunit
MFHPASTAELVDVVRRANEDDRRLLVVGGRRHIDRGNPCDVDGELWTTQLDRLIAYEPAEMIAVVEAGMRVGDLERALLEGGQEWPVDAPADATVGGVIASAASSPRRLEVGAVRDTVLEAEVVTGDGRLIRSGARTVKNVTGYDLHKLVAGSLGTLGVIAQVALKVRPLPRAARTLRFDGGAVDLARSLLEAVPGAAGILATPDGAELRLEGWDEEVANQVAAARVVAEPSAEPEMYPSTRPWDDHSVVAELAVPPSSLGTVLESRAAFGALAGVGIAWVGLDDGASLETLRARAADVGGIAPVIRGSGGLGDAPLAAPDVQRRLKDAFDPNGVLAPGRGWGGI